MGHFYSWPKRNHSQIFHLPEVSNAMPNAHDLTIKSKVYQHEPVYNHLVMTKIAMQNPNHKWTFIAGKIIYFNGPWLPWLC
jgi:hypothetical protein